MKAIILAGGKGSRFAPVTDTIPKALLAVTDEKILIELVLNSLPEKIDTIIITIKYLGGLIQDHIGTTYKNKKIFYAQQTEQNGTWAALYCAKEYIQKNELFCVFNCDDVFDKNELENILKNPIIGIGATRTVFPAKYHGVRKTIEGTIEKLERHPHENREEQVEDIFTNGFFILDTTVFDFPPIALIDGEYGLPQTLLAQKDIYPLFVHEMKHWQPCNTPEDLERIKNPTFKK